MGLRAGARERKKLRQVRAFKGEEKNETARGGRKKMGLRRAGRLRKEQRVSTQERAIFDEKTIDCNATIKHQQKIVTKSE